MSADGGPPGAPQGLFRREAVSHAHRRLKGEIVLAAPLPGRLLGAALVAAVAIGLILAATASYARKETVPGWVMPQGGIIRVTARDGGVVEAIRVREGERVAQGAPLVTLRLSTDVNGGDTGRIMEAQMAAEGAAADAETQAGKVKLRTQRAAFVDRAVLLRRQLAEAKDRILLLRQRSALARAAADRGEGLLKQGYLARTSMDQLTVAALAAAQDVSVAQAQAGDLDRQLSDLDHDLAALPLDMAVLDARAAQNRATLSQKRAGVQAQSVFLATAPIAGRVVAVPVEQGETTRPGAAVAVLMPLGSDLTAELYVPSRAAGFIRPGQDVRLMYQAFPYQVFGAARGVVKSVSATVLAPSEVAIPGLTVNEPVFRVRVALQRQDVLAYGKRISLQPGMLLSADVVIDRRNLLQWLLDPLYAAGRRA
jgi:membrane fusion protein